MLTVLVADKGVANGCSEDSVRIAYDTAEISSRGEQKSDNQERRGKITRDMGLYSRHVLGVNLGEFAL